MLIRRMLWFLGLTTLPLVACGTSASSAGSAISPEGKPPGATTTKNTTEAPTEGTSVTTGPQKPSCADGSCFECGEGICPVGFYCQKSGTTAGCAWAEECAQKPSCACLAALAPGCTCQESSGFPQVTCGS